MTNECPECQRPLPHNAPAGICPHCLLLAGLQKDSSNVNSPTVMQQPQPLSVESLSPLFEQLEILELLGQGGMGAVYKARQLKLDRLIALKMLKPDSAEDGTFAERFNREARTMARLSHPQIVGVHDFGEVQSLSNVDSPEGLPRRLYYILMEYVEGENLRQTMQRGGIEPTRAISIITQVCTALQFAHQEGVIHRDIKPENILIDKRGAVKIADFGLAKLATPSEHDFTLTGTHQVMGTPRYMAPEQMAGSREVDRRADIYALGVVFYEMLTGDIPAGHFSPPSEQSDLDPRFDEILMRMLANRPENRFANAEEILQALQSEGTLPFPVVSSPAHSRMGVSTIMERGVAAAWDWMRATPASESSSKTEESSTSDRNSAVPMLMAVLCLLGVMLIPAPWMVVNITDPDFVRGLKVDQTSVVQSRTTYQMVKSGIEYWSGLATMGALIGLLVSIFAFPSGRTASRWKPIVMTTFSVLALISVGAFWMEVERTRLEYRYVPDPKSKIFSLEKTLFHGVSDLEHHSDLQPAYLLCLGMAGIALLLSAREIGQVTTNAGSTSKTKPEVEEEKEFWSKTPITSLRFPIPQNGEIASKIAFHFRGIGYEMTEELPDCWIFERGALMGGLVQSDIRAYPTRLTVQAIDVEDQSRMISCHWSVKTMGSGSGKKEIRRLENEARDLQRLLGAEISEAAEREADLVAIEEEVGGVSLSLIIVGVLTVIGHLVFMIVSIFQSSQAVLPWLTLPGLFSSVLVLVAGFHLQSLRSRTWVQVGVIAGMLPVTPTWVLSVGFCIWGLMAISDPEVKHAFLTKRRRREEEEEERLAQWQARKQLHSEAIEPSTSDAIDTFAAEQEVGSPALGMIIFGTLTMVGHLLMFIHEMRIPNRMDYAWMWIAGVLSGLTMLIGGLCMRRLTSISWARISVIAGALPTSPAWIINMFMSGWANQALQNTEVKAAFLERARLRKQALTKVDEESTDLDMEALQQEVSGPSIA